MERKNVKQEIDTEEAFRSLGRFFAWLEGKISPSDFLECLAKSRIECLKRIRSLIDRRIEDLEKKHPRKADRRATEVKVE